MQYFVPCKNCLFIACKLSKYNISWSEGGVFLGNMMSTRGEGVMEKWMNMDRGREGVKNPGNFADVICTWPLTVCSHARLDNFVQ